MQPPSQDPTNQSNQPEQPSSYLQPDQTMPPQPLPGSAFPQSYSQGEYPGQEAHYGVVPPSPTGNYPNPYYPNPVQLHSPKQRNPLTIVVLILAALVIILGAITALTLLHTSSLSVASTPTPTQHATTGPATTATTATSPGSGAPQTGATAQVTPTVSATDWGVLNGDTITINQMLTPCGGCPDPILVKIETIQVVKSSEEMIWDIHLSAPTSTQENGYKDASFPEFAIQSDATPSCSASVSNINNSQNDLQGNFPCVPLNNQIYTLSVTLSYHTLSGGVESIEADSISFQPVTLSFNS